MKTNVLLFGLTTAVLLFNSPVLKADSQIVSMPGDATLYQQVAGSVNYATAQTNCSASSRNKTNYLPGHRAQIQVDSLRAFLTNLMTHGTSGWVNQNSWTDGFLVTNTTVKWYDNTTSAISVTGQIGGMYGAIITGYSTTLPNPATYSLSLNTSSQLVLKSNASTSKLPYYICAWDSALLLRKSANADKTDSNHHKTDSHKSKNKKESTDNKDDDRK